jgi:hypothetical protein
MAIKITISGVSFANEITRIANGKTLGKSFPKFCG